uniref:Uncharacterized protein n=1 Tax=Arundo donax TaxID=35708 RepID=A0A0A9B090_ARUDO
MSAKSADHLFLQGAHEYACARTRDTSTDVTSQYAQDGKGHHP